MKRGMLLVALSVAFAGCPCKKEVEPVAKIVIDCIAQDRAKIDALGAELQPLIVAGDWTTFEAKANGGGVEIGGCIAAELINRYLAPPPGNAAPPPRRARPPAPRWSTSAPSSTARRSRRRRACCDARAARSPADEARPTYRAWRAAPRRGAAVLPAAPLARNWSRYYQPDGSLGSFIPLGTFSNMQYGDCTCAAFGHLDEAVCAATNAPTIVTTPMVLEAYDAISPWDANKPLENDVGAFNLDALRWFKDHGLITGFASLYSRAHVETCINLFHGVYVGVELPLSAKTQQTWDVAPPGSTDPKLQAALVGRPRDDGDRLRPGRRVVRDLGPPAVCYLGVVQHLRRRGLRRAAQAARR